MLFSSLPDFTFSQWTIYHFKGVFCHLCGKQNLWLQLFLLFNIGFLYVLLLFFFLRDFPVIAFHWKAEHCYRLNNCWNLQGPFSLATLFIGWIGRFGGWAGDFFRNSQGDILKNWFPMYFFLINCTIFFPWLPLHHLCFSFNSIFFRETFADHSIKLTLFLLHSIHIPSLFLQQFLIITISKYLFIFSAT